MRKRQPGNFLSIRNGDRLMENVTSWSPGPLSRGPALWMVPLSRCPRPLGAKAPSELPRQSTWASDQGCLSRLCDTPTLGSLEVGVTSWVSWDIPVAPKPLPEGGGLPPCLRIPTWALLAPARRRLTRSEGRQDAGEGAVAGADPGRALPFLSIWENNPAAPLSAPLRGAPRAVPRIKANSTHILPWQVRPRPSRAAG